MRNTNRFKRVGLRCLREATAWAYLLLGIAGGVAILVLTARQPRMAIACLAVFETFIVVSAMIDCRRIRDREMVMNT